MNAPTPTDPAERTARDAARQEQALAVVRQALAGLQFGQIAITVQDGVVIQIERTERTRLGRLSRQSNPR